MKNLRASHRENKRYLLIKGKDSDKKIIEELILEFIGVLGFAKASPRFIISKTKTGKNSGETILAVNRNSVDKIRASFIMSGKDIEIEKISGTLKKLK
ncbi:Uncharacterised protein [uncultured archaeon]|nr:Uncharacterised protein [uncultured archaeon]